MKRYFRRRPTPTVEQHGNKNDKNVYAWDKLDAHILNHIAHITRSLLVTYKDSYLVYFDTLLPQFCTLLQPTRSITDRQLALCVFDDIIRFSGSHSHRYSEFFLHGMTEGLSDSSVEVEFIGIYSKNTVFCDLIKGSSSCCIWFRCDGNEWWLCLC